MIVVLEPAVTDDALARVREGLERAGWASETSRGEEQVVLVLSGVGGDDALAAALAPAGPADVFPLLSSGRYRRLRVQRRFLAAMAWGLAGLIAAGILLPILGFLLPQETSLSDPELVRVTSVRRVPEDAGRLVSFHGRPVLVVRRPGDRFFALSASCTYVEACQLEWDADLHRLACPCHGDAWDVHGNLIHGPAATPLVTYGVERLGDDLYLRRRG